MDFFSNIYHDLTNRFDDACPLWDVRKNEKQYVEFELFAQNIDDCNNNVCLNDINHNYYTCHICDVNIPILYSTQHNEGMKHKTFKKIIEICLDRLKRHITNDFKDRNTVKYNNIHFCDNCAVAVSESEKFSHTLSTEHLNNVAKDKRLVEFKKILLNAKEFEVEDPSKEKEPTIVNIVSRIETYKDIDTSIKKDLLTNNYIEENDTTATKNINEDLGNDVLYPVDYLKKIDGETHINRSTHETKVKTIAIKKPKRPSKQAKSTKSKNTENNSTLIKTSHIKEPQNKSIKTDENYLSQHFKNDKNVPTSAICLVCNVKLPKTKHNMAEHAKSIKHTTKYNELYHYFENYDGLSENLICLVCIVTVTNNITNITDHARSKKHTTKFNSLLANNSIIENGNLRHCQICFENFASDKVFDHIAKKEHKSFIRQTFREHESKLGISQDDSTKASELCNRGSLDNVCDKNVLFGSENKYLSSSLKQIFYENKIRLTETGQYCCEHCDQNIKRGWEEIHVKSMYHKIKMELNLSDVSNKTFEEKQDIVHALQQDEILSNNKKVNDSLDKLADKNINVSVNFEIASSDVKTPQAKTVQAAESDISHHFKNYKNIPASAICLVCDVILPKNNITEHSKSLKHTTKFSELCHHYEKGDILMSTCVNCLVCNVKVPYCVFNMTGHARSIKHTTKFNSLLTNNNITVCESPLDSHYCQMCLEHVANDKVFDHIDKEVHKSHIRGSLQTSKKQDSKLGILQNNITEGSEICDKNMLTNNSEEKLNDQQNMIELESVENIDQNDAQTDNSDDKNQSVSVPYTDAIDLTGKNHLSENNKLLTDNLIQVDDKEFCEISDKTVNHQEVHINAAELKNNNEDNIEKHDIFEEKESLSKFDKSNERPKQPEQETLSVQKITCNTISLEYQINLTKPGELNCNICEEIVKKSEMLQHSNSDKHLQMMRETIELNKMSFYGTCFTCAACNLDIATNDALTHLKTAYHKKMLFSYCSDTDEFDDY